VVVGGRGRGGEFTRGTSTFLYFLTLNKDINIYIHTCTFIFNLKNLLLYLTSLFVNERFQVSKRNWMYSLINLCYFPRIMRKTIMYDSASAYSGPSCGSINNYFFTKFQRRACPGLFSALWVYLVMASE